MREVPSMLTLPDIAATKQNKRTTDTHAKIHFLLSETAIVSPLFSLSLSLFVSLLCKERMWGRTQKKLKTVNQKRAHKTQCFGVLCAERKNQVESENELPQSPVLLFIYAITPSP